MQPTPDIVTTILYSPKTYIAVASLAAVGFGWFTWNKMTPAAKAQAKVSAAVGLVLCGAVGWFAYKKGAESQQPQYRFLTYIDGQTLEVAKDMQAMCDERKICKPAEIKARWEDATGVGKVKAGLQ